MEEIGGKSRPLPYPSLCSTNNSQHNLASTMDAPELFTFDFYRFVSILQLYYKPFEGNSLALYF